MTLNALSIDPRRLWKGPWRWFTEDMLDCCRPLEVTKTRGVDLDLFCCIARCNAASAELVRAWGPGTDAGADPAAAAAARARLPPGPD